MEWWCNSSSTVYNDIKVTEIGSVPWEICLIYNTCIRTEGLHYKRQMFLLYLFLPSRTRWHFNKATVRIGVRYAVRQNLGIQRRGHRKVNGSNSDKGFYESCPVFRRRGIVFPSKVATNSLFCKKKIFFS